MRLQQDALSKLFGMPSVEDEHPALCASMYSDSCEEPVVIGKEECVL
jgi:hypothetical protein